MEMKPNVDKEVAKEEAQAQVEIWKYVFGFTPMAMVKCAIDLEIADVLERHGGSINLPELSAALGCSTSVLQRIMRYLMHRGFFKLKPDCIPICYTQTPLSRLLMKDGVNSMAPFIMFESSPVMLAPWLKLSQVNGASSAFESANGDDIWKYAAANPNHSKLINDAMACHARAAIPAIIDQYPEAFEGIESIVDVGGGDGTALRTLVKARPCIGRAINFDLPHVVSAATSSDGVEFVGGDMFKNVPKADAAFLMWVLHDWSDDECICILRNCLEAIPKDTGKVIIVEAVIGEGGEEEEDEYSDVRLALDMVMLAHTEKGKERSYKEWAYVLDAAGFGRFTVKRIEEVVAVIEAYPSTN